MSWYDQQGAFSGVPDTYILWENFNKLVKRLLIELENYKNDEFKRIVINGNPSIVPKYCIEISGPFVCQNRTIVEYQMNTDNNI